MPLTIFFQKCEFGNYWLWVTNMQAFKVFLETRSDLRSKPNFAVIYNGIIILRSNAKLIYKKEFSWQSDEIEIFSTSTYHL